MPASTTPNSPAVRPRSRVLGLLTALPLIAFFLGAIVTAVAWHQVGRANQTHLALRFDAHFQRLVDTLEHQIDIHILALRSVGGLFAGSEQITREEFHDYVAAMQLPRHLPGVQAVGYAHAVPASELAAHVDQVRAGGVPEYRVWPPSDRADHAPLLYVEPYSADNRRALGFDLLTDTVRAAALAQAARNEDISMTPPLQLLSEGEDGNAGGLALYLPDYCAPEKVGPAEAATPPVCGWIFMGIHINSTVLAALGRELAYFDSELAIAIIDDSAAETAPDVYQSAEFGKDLDLQYQRQTTLPTAGRNWTVTAHALPHFFTSYRDRSPQWMLAAGSAVTLLAALFFLLLARNYRRLLTVIDEAVEAQHQLAINQEQLQASERSHREMFAANPIPMWVYDLETLHFLAANDAAIRRYGYSREEFLDMQITQIHPAEDLPRLHANIAAVTTGFDDAGLWRHLTRDGRCIDVDIRSSVLNFNGRRAELVIARDVTAHLQAEAKLVARNQELERFNRLMVNRELAMIDLKREVNSLSRQLGLSPPHDLAAIDDAQRARDPGDGA